MPRKRGTITTSSRVVETQIDEAIAQLRFMPLDQDNIKRVARQHGVPYLRLWWRWNGLSRARHDRRMLNSRLTLAEEQALLNYY
jgi:transposase-like protein